MTAPPSTSRASTAFIAVTPTLFVVLWSTGFIGMRLGIPYAEPFTFMLLRMVLVVTLLGIAAAVWRPAWPGSWRKGARRPT